ncbi:MAG: hypothetical protein SVT56_08850 [Chloroflexota bacterium]|nr:hypothetical protein [Chloroflexota bacterium]
METENMKAEQKENKSDNTRKNKKQQDKPNRKPDVALTNEINRANDIPNFICNN